MYWRRFRVDILLPVVTLFLLPISAAPAFAQYSLCNNASLPIFSAVGYYTASETWRAKGWFKIWPGECKQLLDNIPSRYVYYYAETKNGLNRKPLALWGNGASFCVSPTSRFEIDDTAECESGYEKTEFNKVDTEGKASFRSSVGCVNSKNCDMPVVSYDWGTKRAFVYNVFDYDSGQGVLQADSRTFVSFSDVGTSIKADLQAFVDFEHVQRMLPGIVRIATLFDDGSCGGKFDLFNIALEESGGSAVLTTEGRYRYTSCTIMTVPQFECDSILVWECDTWLDETTVAEVTVSQSGFAEFRVVPVIRGSDIAFDVEVTSVRLNGVGQGLADLLDLNVKGWVAAGIDNVVPKDLMRYSAPAEIRDFIRLSRVAFTRDGGLTLEIEGSATIPKGEILGLCQGFWPNGNCRLQQ